MTCRVHLAEILLLRAARILTFIDMKPTTAQEGSHGPAMQVVMVKLKLASMEPLEGSQCIHAMQDVIVKVALASICGSDMHPYAGRGVQLDEGIIFGHEFVGEVVDVGPEVHHFRPYSFLSSSFFPVPSAYDL